MEVGIKQDENSSTGAIQKSAGSAQSLGVAVLPLWCLPDSLIRYLAETLMKQGLRGNLCRFIAVNSVLFAVNKLTEWVW